MKSKLLFALTTVLVWIASPAVLAQTTGPGPYYATPSWDQKLQCDTQATCPRFIVLSNWTNEAVLDRETGLVWERSPSTTLSDSSWATAQRHCNELVISNRIGWRLPALQELESLIDRSQSGPALPAGHPFNNVQGAVYWSATTTALDSSLAWGVGFFEGNVTFGAKFGGGLAWCVRGGQGVDPQ